MIAPKLTALLKKINETKGNTSTKFAVFELTSYIPFDVIDKKSPRKRKQYGLFEREIEIESENDMKRLL